MSRRAVTPAGRRRAAARTAASGAAEARVAKAGAATGNGSTSGNGSTTRKPPASGKPSTKRKPSTSGKASRGQARSAPPKASTSRAPRPRLARRSSTSTPRARPAPRRGRATGRAGGASRWRRVPRGAWRLVRGKGSLRRRAILALAVVAALAAFYFAWFRDSSLVAVKSVEIEGLGGGDASPAAAALTSAAQGMTTLDVDSGRLDAVAAGFPEIASVSADPAFPNGMTIHVTERPPVLLARDGGRTVPVAADGTLLVGERAPKVPKLPSLAVHPLPDVGRLSGDALQQALVVGAAPAPLRREVSGLSFTRDSGVTATMNGGIELRFGTAGAARAKWAAVAAVLADRRLTTLAYVDVRVPQRPTVG